MRIGSFPPPTPERGLRRDFCKRAVADWTIRGGVGANAVTFADSGCHFSPMTKRIDQSDDHKDDPSAHRSLLELVTPLARQINSLDMDRIANVCVTKIPTIVGSTFASLYVLDEPNHILHLVRCNHPFPINKIVSLNQTPA